MEATSSEQLEEVRRKISVARRYALKHFNASQAKDTRFVDENLNALPPSFFVEFPDVDKMRVTPSFFGQMGTLPLWFNYVLRFYENGRTAWCGKHPIFGTQLPRIMIAEEETV